MRYTCSNLSSNNQTIYKTIGIFNALAKISTKGSEQARENARHELLSLSDEVDRFVKSDYFEEGKLLLIYI
jgi:hypothetical protein